MIMEIKLMILYSKLAHMQAQVQGHLIKIQSSFRDDLLGKVEIFKQDTEEFYKDYATVYIYYAY